MIAMGSLSGCNMGPWRIQCQGITCQRLGTPAAAAQRGHAPRSSRHTPRAAETAAAPPAPAEVAALKSRVIQLAGSKYGHDLDAGTKSQLEKLCEQLGSFGLNTPRLAPGKWRLVYSNSTGNSSGKIGPFLTDVEQLFPETEANTYYNISRLGPLSATLKGECGITPSQPTRVNLEFKEVVLQLGQVQLAKKEWLPGQMRGHWAASYWDDDFRVFFTNKGSLFVLRREA